MLTRENFNSLHIDGGGICDNIFHRQKREELKLKSRIVEKNRITLQHASTLPRLVSTGAAVDMSPRAVIEVGPRISESFQARTHFQNSEN